MPQDAQGGVFTPVALYVTELHATIASDGQTSRCFNLGSARQAQPIIYTKCTQFLLLHSDNMAARRHLQARLHDSMLHQMIDASVKTIQGAQFAADLMHSPCWPNAAFPPVHYLHLPCCMRIQSPGGIESLCHHSDALPICYA